MHFGSDFSSLQQSIKRAVLQALDVFQLARIVEVILSGQPSKTIRNRKQQVNSMAIVDLTNTHELCPKTVGSPSNCWGAFLHSSSHCSTAWHAACWLTQHLSGLGFGVFPGQTKVLKDFGLGGVLQLSQSTAASDAHYQTLSGKSPSNSAIRAK